MTSNPPRIITQEQFKQFDATIARTSFTKNSSYHYRVEDSLFDSITFFLFNNSNESINDQNTYSNEFCKGYVKLLEIDLHDPYPTKVQTLKIFVKNTFVDHIDKS